MDARATYGKRAASPTRWFRYLLFDVCVGRLVLILSFVKHWGYSDTVGLAYFDTKDNSMSTAKREQIESEVDK